MSEKNSLYEIKSEIDRLAARIGAPADLLPTYGDSVDGARPHIEVDARGFHYVVVERGRELSRVTTDRLDELLFHVFRDVTFALAGQYELQHRIENQDPRRLAFQYQIDLLSRLSTRWSEMESRRHASILERHPYDDLAAGRATLARTLRDQGLAPDVAWKKACEKYPFPGT